MRQMLVLSVLIGSALIMSVFVLKYDVQGLEAELINIERSIDEDRQAILTLKAEWSYMNNPQRLKKQASDNLGLVPILSEQVITISRIEDVVPERVDVIPVPANAQEPVQ